MKTATASIALMGLATLGACVSVNDQSTALVAPTTGDFVVVERGETRDRVAAIASAATYEERATRATVASTTVWKSTRPGEDYLVHVVRTGSDEIADEFIVIIAREGGGLVSRGVIAF
jgi:hypothetical protein